MAAGSMGRRTTQSKIAAFTAALRKPCWTTGIEFALTAMISLCAIVFLGVPLFVRITPTIYVILTYASLLMGIFSIGLLIRVLFAGIKKSRVKFMLYSLVPLILSYFLFILSVLLVNGYAVHVGTYWRLLEHFQKINVRGIDRFLAVQLLTWMNLNAIWMLLCQFASVILGWGLWFANISNIISVLRQIHDYDSMVTFPDEWLWLLGLLTLLAMVLSLIIF